MPKGLKGSARIAVARAKRRNKKRVAKKIAYGGITKQQRVKSNAIFKETKTRTDEEVHARFSAALPAAYYNQNPLVFHPFPTADKVFPLKIFALDAQQQGMDENMMNGRAVYAKYMKMKIQLRFPEGAATPQDQPDIYIVHGWIKKSPGLNGIQEVDNTVNPEQWTLQNDWNWMRAELEPYFDEREDKLRYIPKQNSNLAIAGYHRIKPQQREGFGRVRTSGLQASDGTPFTIGTLRDYHRTVSWKMMRKIHYEVGAADQFQSEAAHISRTNMLYINMNQWRPFCCLYCPQYGAPGVTPPLSSANLPSVAYNSILYYTDS